MHADRGIGRARAAGDEGDAGPAGQRAIGARHEAHAAFLPAHDEIDRRRVVQRVEHREEALAGHGEDAIAALQGELVDQDTAAGAGSVHGADISRGDGAWVGAGDCRNVLQIGAGGSGVNHRIGGFPRLRQTGTRSATVHAAERPRRFSRAGPRCFPCRAAPPAPGFPPIPRHPELDSGSIARLSFAVEALALPSRPNGS